MPTEDSTTEIWKPIPITPYSSFYQVSNKGRLRRTVPGVHHPQRPENSLLSTRGGGRYAVRRLSAKGESKYFRVSGLVTLAFLGPKPIGKQVNHIDGQTRNDCIENLEYVTPSENRRHAERLGLQKHKKSMVSTQSLQEISRLLNMGVPCPLIADAMGGHLRLIQYLKANSTHV